MFLPWLVAENSDFSLFEAVNNHNSSICMTWMGMMGSEPYLSVESILSLMDLHLLVHVGLSMNTRSSEIKLDLRFYCLASTMQEVWWAYPFPPLTLIFCSRYTRQTVAWSRSSMFFPLSNCSVRLYFIMWGPQNLNLVIFFLVIFSVEYSRDRESKILLRAVGKVKQSWLKEREDGSKVLLLTR